MRALVPVRRTKGTPMLKQPVTALCVLLVAACSKSGAPSQTPACQSATDCAAGQTCLDQACVAKCASSAQCGGLVCDDGACQTPACGADSECTGGLVCVSGKCAAAPAAAAVAFCEITPNPSLVNQGKTTQLAVIAKGADGRALRFSAFTWSGSSAGGAVDANGLVTGAGAGDLTVTATVVGASTSCTVVVHGYAASVAPAFRVTVIDQHTRAPIPGASVVLDNVPVSGAPPVTGADGSLTLAGITGGHNVHVIKKGYSYTTFANVDAGADLLVPLARSVLAAERSGFTARTCETRAADASCDTEFAPLRLQGESVHLALFGSGIPNSLLELSGSTLFGPSHAVTLSFGGTTTPATLPYGVVLGSAANFFGTQDYRVFPDASARALWGLGGNLPLADVTAALAPVLSGATADAGSLLPRLLPLLSRTQGGAVVGVHAPANGAPPTFQKQPVPLDTALRLRATLTLPDLPVQGAGNYLDGVIAVAGAMDYPVGFVPLGMTAASSVKDAQNKNTAKTHDSTCAGSCPDNVLALRLAPLNNGTEGKKIGIVALALNFGALSPGSTQRAALSGLVTVVDELKYDGATPAAIAAFPGGAFLPFLDLSGSIPAASVSKSARSVTVTAASDTRDLYRFEVANSAGLTWNIWIAPNGATQIVLPDPTLIDPTLGDPFQDSAPTARLVRGRYRGIAAVGMESFRSSPTLDQSGDILEAFTALQIDVGP